jgi:GT2 family glycosyltransferase
MRLSVVIVTWNRAALLRACLESLVATQEERPQVVVVANRCTDDTLAMLAERSPWVRVLESERNVGFAQANNLGVEVAEGEVVLLLNDDTVVLESFAPLLRAFDDPALGAVGPCLVGTDGERQLSARAGFPTVRSVLRDYVRGERSAGAGEVAWVAGAAFFVRRDAYHAAGGLDERYFMFFEETDLCRRLHERGLRVVYDPSVTVRHLGGAAVGVPLFVERAYYESLFRYLGVAGARGVPFLRAALALGAGVRALAALARGRPATARRLAVAAATCLGLGADARSRAG